MLPANQKKVLELIVHPTTLSCLKPSRSSGLLSMSCPFCLLGALQIKPSLLSNTCGQSLAFCAKGTRVTLLMPSFSILTFELSCGWTEWTRDGFSILGQKEKAPLPSACLSASTDSCFPLSTPRASTDICV